MRENHPADPTEDELPSQGVRTLLSFLLFVHLFMVVLAIASYTNSSGLQQRLRARLSPYLQTLNIDLLRGYYSTARYYQTHADPELDTDFVLEVDVKRDDGQVEKVMIPQAGLAPGRYYRWQQLAMAVGGMVRAEDVATELPRTIAAALMQQRGASRGTVRCLAHELPEIQAGPVTTRQPPRNIFEAEVLISEGGVVDVVKKSSALEVAPVEKGQ